MPLENESKYVPPFQRPQTKDSFDKLFENGSKTFSAEKVSNLRTFLQNSMSNKSDIHQNGKSQTQHNSPPQPETTSLKQNLKIY